MNDICTRTKINFIGTHMDQLNMKQNEWRGFLPEISEEGYPECIEIHLEYEGTTIKAIDKDIFYFKGKQDCEDFAKMLFYLWNNGGSTIDLDYADLCQYFSSSNNLLYPILSLSKEELTTINSGSIVCFSLRPVGENALKDIYEIAEHIENSIGNEVVFLISDLIIPKIENIEVHIFHIKK